jgi:hypothetical protein
VVTRQCAPACRPGNFMIAGDPQRAVASTDHRDPRR